MPHGRRASPVYHVQVDGIPDAALLRAIADGIDVAGERLHAKSAALLRSGTKHAWLAITLDQGRNRQIRRLLEGLGMGVLRLVRVSVGRVVLGDLAKGAWRPLSAEEVASLASTDRDRAIAPGAR